MATIHRDRPSCLSWNCQYGILQPAELFLAEIEERCLMEEYDVHAIQSK
jgi:hypothetical protein